jgi:hypothetical protein
VPANATAFALNVTAIPVNGNPLGFLTLWPAGSARPLASTLNALTGTVVANLAIVPAGAGGAVSAYVTEPSHLAMDITGYFADGNAPGASNFYTVTPCRVLDTRDPFGPLGGPAIAAQITKGYPVSESPCAVPNPAISYAMNATVIPDTTLGYLTLRPGNGIGLGVPSVSTLNALDGSLTSNAAILRVVSFASERAAFNAFVTERTHLLVDVSGYFAPVP